VSLISGETGGLSESNPPQLRGPLLWESWPEVSGTTSTDVGAMIRSKMSYEVAADTKEKEDPEAASRSPATSSTMAAPEASASASARETSLAADDDTLQERDRNSSGSRGGSGGRSGRSPSPQSPGLLALAAPALVMVGAWTVACSACTRSCRAWGLQRGGLWWRAWEWARVRGQAEGGCMWAQAAWRARPGGGDRLTEWPAAQDRGGREEKCERGLGGRGRGAGPRSREPRRAGRLGETRVGFFLFLLFLF
jgi:hypothetical protein